MHRAGIALTKRMQQRVGQKLGIDQVPAEPNEPSTKKGKGGKDHRLVKTGFFKKYAYNYRSAKQSVTLFVSQRKHPKGNATLEDIGVWNQKGHPGQSSGIPKASKHFGISKSDADYWRKKFLKEAGDQLARGLEISGTIRIDV